MNLVVAHFEYISITERSSHFLSIAPKSGDVTRWEERNRDGKGESEQSRSFADEGQVLKGFVLHLFLLQSSAFDPELTSGGREITMTLRKDTLSLPLLLFLPSCLPFSLSLKLVFKKWLRNIFFHSLFTYFFR